MNNLILKAHLEGVEMFSNIRFVSENALCCPECNSFWPISMFMGFDLTCRKEGCDGICETPEIRYIRQVKSFLTTYGINLLKAAKEVAGKSTIHKHCTLSFTSAIDDGIKEIEKGEV